MNNSFLNVEVRGLIFDFPNLRFPGFEEEWEEKKLKEITNKINSGKTPLGGEAVYIDDGIFFIRSQNVNNDRLDFENQVFISEDINNSMKNSVVKSNDILLNITGASLGRSCVVPENFSLGNVNQHVCIIRTIDNYNPRFIQPFLSSTKGQEIFKSLQTGSGREGLNFDSIKNIKLSYPSFEEQNKVSLFISHLDDRIQTQKKIIEQLETLMKASRENIFSQKLRFKNENDGFYSEWKSTTLKNITQIFDGTHQTPKYVKKGVPFYSVENVTANNFSVTKYISEEVFTKENNRVKIEKGDILMTRIGDIGTVKYIDWNVNASFYVSLALIKNNNNYHSKYLAQYISSEKFQNELWNRTIHVAFPKKINLGEIGECLLKIPCIEEQKKIANFLFSIQEKLEIEKQILEKLELQKKFLLANLFV